MAHTADRSDGEPPPLRRRLDGPAPTRESMAALVVGWDRRPASTAAVQYGSRSNSRIA
ncbi:hypothetical protein QSJ19_25040 [Gordonia sp. ABSL11-1]|nr:hypothetical protein [Gordonia sp. ABSL11-1]MDL9948790.1 hypothetical protein [Gordonia sp. ABSL11-1]